VPRDQWCPSTRVEKASNKPSVLPRLPFDEVLPLINTLYFRFSQFSIENLVLKDIWTLMKFQLYLVEIVFYRGWAVLPQECQYYVDWTYKANKHYFLPVSDLGEWRHICHFFRWQTTWRVTFVTFLGRMWRSRTRKYFLNLRRFLSHFPKNVTF